MPTLPYEYSEKEIGLMKELGVLDIASSPSQVPVLMYHIMALICFRDNRQDNVSDSVRRCLIACENNKTNRLTPEFDSLISA